MDAVPVAAHVQGVQREQAVDASDALHPLEVRAHAKVQGIALYLDASIVVRAGGGGRNHQVDQVRVHPTPGAGAQQLVHIDVPQGIAHADTEVVQQVCLRGIGRLEVHGAGVLPDAAHVASRAIGEPGERGAGDQRVGAVHAEVRRAHPLEGGQGRGRYHGLVVLHPGGGAVREREVHLGLGAERQGHERDREWTHRMGSISEGGRFIVMFRCLQ